MVANDPLKKTSKYLNLQTSKIDTIEFPDYKKWYTTNSAVWKSTKHANAYTYKLKYFDEKQAKRTIKKTQNDLRKYRDMLEDMNKIYAKVDHRVYESTNWTYYFYGNINRTGELAEQEKKPALVF